MVLRDFAVLIQSLGMGNTNGAWKDGFAGEW